MRARTGGNAAIEARRHDLIVVGAGSGGYAAARTARDVGCDVALVDTGPLGGLCAFCVAACRAKRCSRPATRLRTRAMPSTWNPAADDIARRHAVHRGPQTRARARSSPTIGSRESRSFRSIAGAARFVSPTRSRSAKNVLRSAEVRGRHGQHGSRERAPGFAETGYIDSDGVLEIERIPEVRRRVRRRLYRLRAGSVSGADGRDDDDAHPQRASPDRKRRRRRGCSNALFS